MNVIHLDNHLLAVDKPSGLPSQPDATGDPSLIDMAKAHVKAEFSKPGEVYLALLHRLDRPTSGLVLMARTGKAAGRMAEQFRKREVGRTYLAAVHCHAEPQAKARLTDILIPAENGGMRPVSGKTRSDDGRAREADLTYTLAGRTAGGEMALLAVRLETGVKHQIRCQLAAAGLPVAGDFRYGPFGRVARPEPAADGRAVLLHAARLEFIHPVRREPVRLAASLPPHWDTFLAKLPAGTVPALEDDSPWQA